MSRGRRQRIERGIFSDRFGYAAIVSVGGARREKRFPADIDPDQIRRWRAQTQDALLATRGQNAVQRADPRSLARSIVLYLRRREGRPGAKADRAHLKAWLPTLGSLRRHMITPGQVRAVLETWQAARLNPTTIRHRARVLRELYQTLDGPTAIHPLLGLRLPKRQTPSPTPIAKATIQQVAQSLANSAAHKSRGRFLVYATTGQRPAQIGRALLTDVDLVRKVWFVRPAKGGDPIPLPLNAEMVKAWKVFAQAKAWGTFDPTSLAKTLRRHGWPVGVRPYQLRHTFAIDLLLGGTDLGDVQGLLGHTSIQTTRQFYAPILMARLTKAVKTRRLMLASATQVVPRDATVVPHNAPVSATFRHVTKRGFQRGK